MDYQDGIVKLSELIPDLTVAKFREKDIENAGYALGVKHLNNYLTKYEVKLNNFKNTE